MSNARTANKYSLRSSKKSLKEDIGQKPNGLGGHMDDIKGKARNKKNGGGEINKSPTPANNSDSGSIVNNSQTGKPPDTDTGSAPQCIQNQQTIDSQATPTTLGEAGEPSLIDSYTNRISMDDLNKLEKDKEEKEIMEDWGLYLQAHWAEVSEPLILMPSEILMSEKMSNTAPVFHTMPPSPPPENPTNEILEECQINLMHMH